MEAEAQALPAGSHQDWGPYPPSPEDLHNSGFPKLQADSLPFEPCMVGGGLFHFSSPHNLFHYTLLCNIHLTSPSKVCF